ncbi:COMMD8 [Symbiodinium sp. KB8]|nr:COMMD8 [Symbiodinium sp. KB8]
METVSPAEQAPLPSQTEQEVAGLHPAKPNISDAFAALLSDPAVAPALPSLEAAPAQLGDASTSSHHPGPHAPSASTFSAAGTENDEDDFGDFATAGAPHAAPPVLPPAVPLQPAGATVAVMPPVPPLGIPSALPSGSDDIAIVSALSIVAAEIDALAQDVAHLEAVAAGSVPTVSPEVLPRYVAALVVRADELGTRCLLRLDSVARSPDTRQARKSEVARVQALCQRVQQVSLARTGCGASQPAQGASAGKAAEESDPRSSSLHGAAATGAPDVVGASSQASHVPVGEAPAEPAGEAEEDEFGDFAAPEPGAAVDEADFAAKEANIVMGRVDAASPTEPPPAPPAAEVPALQFLTTAARQQLLRQHGAFLLHWACTESSDLAAMSSEHLAHAADGGGAGGLQQLLEEANAAAPSHVWAAMCGSVSTMAVLAGIHEGSRQPTTAGAEVQAWEGAQTPIMDFDVGCAQSALQGVLASVLWLAGEVQVAAQALPAGAAGGSATLPRKSVASWMTWQDAALSGLTTCCLGMLTLAEAALPDAPSDSASGQAWAAVRSAWDCLRTSASSLAPRLLAVLQRHEADGGSVPGSAEAAALCLLSLPDVGMFTSWLDSPATCFKPQMEPALALLREQQSAFLPAAMAMDAAWSSLEVDGLTLQPMHWLQHEGVPGMTSNRVQATGHTPLHAQVDACMTQGWLEAVPCVAKRWGAGVDFAPLPPTPQGNVFTASSCNAWTRGVGPLCSAVRAGQGSWDRPGQPPPLRLPQWSVPRQSSSGQAAWEAALASDLHEEAEGVEAWLKGADAVLQRLQRCVRGVPEAGAEQSEDEASFDSAALNGIAAVTSKVHTEQFVHAVVDATVAHSALSALSRTFAVGPAAPESAFITGIAAATSEAFSKAVGAGLSPAEFATKLQAAGTSAEVAGLLSRVLGVRADDLREGLAEVVSSAGAATLTDFDWSLRMTVSSASIEQVREPRLVLALQTAEHGKLEAEGQEGEATLLELNAEQLDDTIKQLEAAASVMHEVATSTAS